jgi:integrase
LLRNSSFHRFGVTIRAKEETKRAGSATRGSVSIAADGVDIRTIQLMLGHADIKQTERYLNITDEELRKAMTGVWERRRQLKAVSQ